MQSKQVILFVVLIASVLMDVHAQHHHDIDSSNIIQVEPQPLLAQAVRLNEALSFLGSSISGEDENTLQSLQKQPLTAQTVKNIQQLFDPYCLFKVSINPEG